MVFFLIFPYLVLWVENSKSSSSLINWDCSSMVGHQDHSCQHLQDGQRKSPIWTLREYLFVSVNNTEVDGTMVQLGWLLWVCMASEISNLLDLCFLSSYLCQDITLYLILIRNSFRSCVFFCHTSRSKCNKARCVWLNKYKKSIIIWLRDQSFHSHPWLRQLCQNGYCCILVWQAVQEVSSW